MTVLSEARTAGPYTGNGSTVAFSFSFKVFSVNDVQVVRAENGVNTTLTLTTHYSVSLNADQNTSPGGSVTLVTAPTASQKVTIVSDVAYTQSNALSNAGGFYPQVINDMIDRATILAQQNKEELSRAAVAPVGSTISAVDVKAVADISDDIEAVSDIAGDVTTVAGKTAEVSAVAAIADDIVSLTASSPVVGQLPAVADAATLHAQTVVAGRAFIVTSRGDQFIYIAKTGDQSALVDRDEMTAGAGIGGLVVAGGGDPTGASGAWVCTPQFVEVSLYDGDASKAVNGALEFLIPFRGDYVDRAEDAYFARFDPTGLTDAQVQEKFRKTLLWQSQCQAVSGSLADNSSGNFDSPNPGLVWISLPEWTRIDLGDMVAYKGAPGTHPIAITCEGGAPLNTLITGVSHVAGSVADNGTARWREITVPLQNAMTSGGFENVQAGDLCALCVTGESASGEADGPLYNGCWRIKSIAADRLSLVVEGWMENSYLPGTITGLTADGITNGQVNNSISFPRCKITWSGGTAQVEGLFNFLHGGYGITRYLSIDYQGTSNDGSIYYCGSGAKWYGQQNMYFGAPERVYRGFDFSNIRANGCYFGRAKHNPSTKSMENQTSGNINYKRCLGNADLIVGPDTTAEVSQSTVRGEIVVNAGSIGTTDQLTVVGASRAFYVQNAGRVRLTTTTKIDHSALGLDAVGGSLGGYIGDPTFGSHVTTPARMDPNTMERGAVWQRDSLKNPTVIPPEVTIADDDVWEAQVIGKGGRIELSPTRTPIAANFLSILVDAVAAATTITGLVTGSGITIVSTNGATDLGADIANSSDGTISVTVYEDGADYYLQVANRSGSTIGFTAVAFGQMQIEAWTKRI